MRRLHRETIVAVLLSIPLVGFLSGEPTNAADAAQPASAPRFAFADPTTKKRKARPNKTTRANKTTRTKAKTHAKTKRSSAKAASRPARTTQSTIASEASLERFQQLLRRRPLHRPAFEGLVKHYSQRSKLPELVKQYEDKVRALPDEETLRIVLARLYLRSNQPKRALELIDRPKTGQTLKRRDAVAFLSFKSRVYQRVGRGKQAIAILHKALAEAKTIALKTKLTEGLADLYIASKQRKEAAKVLIDLAGAYPKQFFHRKRLADALAGRSLHEEAVGQYRSILKLVEKETDKRCEVLRLMGRSQEKLNRRDKAIGTYTEAMNLLADGHWMQRELHQRVVTLYRTSGRIEELISYCRDRIKRAPEQIVMRELLADVLATAGKTDEARKTLVEAVRLFPRNKSLSRKRIELLERMNDVDGVSAEYERAIAQFSADVEFYISYGSFLARNKQLQKARNQWKHVLNRQVADATLAGRLGTMLEQYELHDDAVDCYRRAIELDSKRTESYLALSRLWLSRGKGDKALAVLKQMSAANPKDAAIQARLSSALLGLSLPDEALVAIAKACQLSPKEYRYQLAHADLLQQKGAIAKALGVRRGALELIPSGPMQMKAVNVLVSMHETAGTLEGLKQAETKRLETAGHDSISLLLLALAADSQRDIVTARNSLIKLLKTEPAHEEGRKQLAVLYSTMGDVERAVREYRTLIDQQPARSRAYYQAIANLKLRYNDEAGAIEIFEELAARSSGNAAALRLVGEQMLALSQSEKALEYFRRSVDLQPQNHRGRLQYARALKDAGQLEEAFAEFRNTALQETDRNSANDATAYLYDTAGQLGNVDSLLDDLRDRVEQNPNETIAARVLTQLYIREFEYARASELLALLLKHHPGDANLRLVRAALNRRLVRFDIAIDEYQRVLRIPNIDRDYVLGELGKTYFEAGRLDEARRNWNRIANKLYAGTLLRNNGMPSDAIEVFREGIRLKPDAFALYRNLISTYEQAGQQDNALKTAKRLLDLEPDSPRNIRQLAEALLKQGRRGEAAKIAGRLFSARLQSQKKSQQYSPYGSSANMSLSMIQMMSAWGYGQSQQHPMQKAVEFFGESGLMRELEGVLTEQLKKQPDNALVKLSAISYFSEKFAKPAKALAILEELETIEFPLEHRTWIGHSSQQEFFQLRQLKMIVGKAVLRDERLTRLSAKKPADLTTWEKIVLSTIRASQGARDQKDEAVRLLEDAAKADPTNRIALSRLVAIFIDDEKYKRAEPYASRLVELLKDRQKQYRGELRERVKRRFVRQLPRKMQLRVTDRLLDDITEIWARGESTTNAFSWGEDNAPMTLPNYYHARMMRALILAKTERIEQAKPIWKALQPSNPADADGWTSLAETAQALEQDDLAFSYYQQAMQAAKLLPTDPLLNRIYGSSLQSIYSWYDETDAIDSAFNRVLDTFSKRDKLLDLYDFLRETGQADKARRVAQGYKLLTRLQKRYKTQLEAARSTYLKSPDDPLQKSVSYFVAVCKLAEVYDWNGKWNEAEKVYRQYLKDFPDELGLIQTLGEIAEVNGDHQQALDWEKLHVDAKKRLARRGPAWSARSVFMVPATPRVLASKENNYSWPSRWGRSYYWWGGAGGQGQFDVSDSLMRIAKLYLALDNTIAAVDAMQQAIGASRTNRSSIADNILAIAGQRQLIKEMLPVWRTLIVQLPANRRVQLSFAESLEQNGKKVAAVEIYQRLLDRGVSDLNVLNHVRRKIASLDPGSHAAAAPRTLADLEAQVQADPENVGNLFRLGKAYYFSLEIDKALDTLLKTRELAPHLKGLDELIEEIYIVQNNSKQRREILRARITRTRNADKRRRIRQKLTDSLFQAGQIDAALEELKKTGDPKDVSTYAQIAPVLQYFGRHDEALEQYEMVERSQGRENVLQNARFIAQALAFSGNLKKASKRIVDAVSETIKLSSTTRSSMMSMYGWRGDQQQNSFASFTPVFVAYPEVLNQVKAKVISGVKARPKNLTARRMAIQLHRLLGREDLADALLKEPEGRNLNDQSALRKQIDRAVKKNEIQKAIRLAEKWLTQQPKPKLPPGIPAQYAARMLLGSERNKIICLVGDLHWRMGHKEKAFESYRRVIDEKVDESKIAYATICAYRGRIPEAAALVDKALKGQKVKSATLLQSRAFLAALENDPRKMFDLLIQAYRIDTGKSDNMYSGYSNDSDPVETLAPLAVETGQIDLFVKFAQEQIQKDPNNWQKHLKLSKFLRDVGRHKEAQAVLDRAGKIKALGRDVLEHRIHNLEKRGEIDTLVPLYRKLIDLTLKRVDSDGSSGSSGALFGFGRARPSYGNESPVKLFRQRQSDLLWHAGQAEESQKVWLAGRDLQSAATYIELAALYAERKDDKRAEKNLREALRLSPENVAAHAGLAGLALHRGDTKEALDHMREVFVQKLQSTGNRNLNYQNYDDSQISDVTENARLLALKMHKTNASPDPDADPDDAPGKTEQRITRLLLALSYGDWAAVDSHLTHLMAGAPYDPMLWNLWTKTQNHYGNWNEVLRGRQQLDRFGKTKLNQRRSKLKLILAGKQIKGAAAGVLSGSQPQPGSARSRSRSYSRSYGGYGRYGSSWGRYYGAEDSPTDIKTLYYALKRFDDVERSLLENRQQFAQGTLPELIKLAHRRGQPERVAELVRLYIGSSEGGGAVDQILDPLIKAGRIDDAIAMLIRQMRLGAQNNRYGRHSHMSISYGMSGAFTSTFDFDDDGNNEPLARLYLLLVQHHKYDETLKTLTAKYQTDPDDFRLAKLIAKLMIMHDDWQKARLFVGELAIKQPKNISLKSLLFNISMQLDDAPAALALAEEIRKQVPKSAKGTWKMRMAAIHLFSGNTQKAVEMLKDDIPQSNDTSESFAALLAATNQIDRTIKQFELRHEKETLDDSGTDRLFQLYRFRKQWDKAALIGLPRVWKSAERIDENGWFSKLHGLVLSAGDQFETLTSVAQRPEDRALLTFLKDGPASGKRAFQSVLEKLPESLDARRALIVAALLDGDLALAAEANSQLLKWIEPRRFETWQSKDKQTSKQRSAAFRKSWSESTSSTSELFENLSLLPQLLQQHLSSSSSGFFDDESELQYDKLRKVHLDIADKLLMRTGKTDAYVRAVRSRVKILVTENPYQNYYGNSDSELKHQLENGRSQEDWRDTVQTTLETYGKISEVVRLLDEQGIRLSEDEWLLMSELCAALGRDEQSNKWKQQWIDNRLASLRASGAPTIDIGIENDDDDYRNNPDYWAQFRDILSSSAPGGSDAGDSSSTYSNYNYNYNYNRYRYRSRRYRRRYFGMMGGYPRSYFRQSYSGGQLSRYAADDPRVEKKLLKLAERLGPGWADTQTANTIISYHFQKKQPLKVIELMERMLSAKQILKPEHLSTYLKASYRAKDYARVEKVLASLETISPKLHHFIALERLMLHRHQNQTKQADALEQKLIAACRTAPPSKWRPDDKLWRYMRDSMQWTSYEGGFGGGRGYYSSQTTQGFDNQSPPHFQLASAVGIEIKPSLKPEDLTLAKIRAEYVNHQLHKEALSIIDREIEQFPKNGFADNRIALIEQKARFLRKTDHKNQAEKLMAEVRAYRRRQSEQDSTTPKGKRFPDASYWTKDRKMTDSDYEKALQQNRDYRKNNWRTNQSRMQDAYYLFKLKRYNDAWTIYENAIRSGEFYNGITNATMYQAGIAAHEAQKPKQAMLLLRRAVWRAPSHELAAKAKELIRDAKKIN